MIKKRGHIILPFQVPLNSPNNVLSELLMMLGKKKKSVLLSHMFAKAHGDKNSPRICFKITCQLNIGQIY